MYCSAVKISSSILQHLGQGNSFPMAASRPQSRGQPFLYSFFYKRSIYRNPVFRDTVDHLQPHPVYWDTVNHRHTTQFFLTDHSSSPGQSADILFPSAYLHKPELLLSCHAATPPVVSYEKNSIPLALKASIPASPALCKKGENPVKEHWAR